MITVQHVVEPMTPEQQANWNLRKRIASYMFAALIVAVVALGILLQVAQNKADAHQAECDLWQNVIDHAPTAIIVCDEAGRIIAWNDGATRLFGWEDAEIMGSTTKFLMPCDELRRKHDELWHDATLKEVLFSGKIFELVTDAMHKDGHTIQVKGKVTGARNDYETFILHFYPNGATIDSGVFSADTVNTVPPTPQQLPSRF